MNYLPSSSLFQSRPARIELARQRFFEEGQAPTGVVSGARSLYLKQLVTVGT